MKTILINILAVLIGFIIGSAVNMFFITISSTIIPLPEGVNPADMNSLIENMHLFKPINFLMPFLAHALGTLVGAFLAFIIARTHQVKFALGISIFFLIGGIANVYLLPSPVWFAVVDILFAYIPMGLLAIFIAKKLFKK